jgi:hypothetical protein
MDGGLDMAWAGRPRREHDRGEASSQPVVAHAYRPGLVAHSSKRQLSRHTALLASLLAASLFLLSGVPASAASAFPRLRRHHRPVPAAIAATTTVPGPTTLTSLPVPMAPPAAPADECFKVSWDAAVEGAPTAFAIGANAAYLWYDADGGWALRFTHASPTSKLIFAGYVRALTGQFLDVSPMSKGGTDIVALSPDKRTIYFRFVDFGLLDGLNFATHCTRAFAVSIHAGGPLLPASQIHLGATAANPPANPFKVGRGSLLAAQAKLQAMRG